MKLEEVLQAITERLTAETRKLGDDILMAWMRERVRCETCRHFPGEERREIDLCGQGIMCGPKEDGLWGCTRWEPKRKRPKP